MGRPRTRFEKIDCDCKSGIRPHGTVHGFNIHRCGCDECWPVYRKYHKAIEFKMDRAGKAGVGRVYVNADKARAHIEILRQRKMKLTTLSKVAGVNYSILKKLVTEPERRTTEETINKILAVRIPPMTDLEK